MSTDGGGLVGRFGSSSSQAPVLFVRVLAGLALGHLPAFVSHWVDEKNQPKTFEQPFLPFAADFVMVYRVLTGTLEVPDPKPS